MADDGVIIPQKLLFAVSRQFAEGIGDVDDLAFGIGDRQDNVLLDDAVVHLEVFLMFLQFFSVDGKDAVEVVVQNSHEAVQVEVTGFVGKEEG